MTPKEKAIELVNSCNDLAKDFTRGVSMNEFSKQFALLMVSEIMFYCKGDYFRYLEEVKQEINNL